MDFQTKINELFSTNEVLTGPFKGLKYPQKHAFFAPVFPNLLGSYEKELHDVIEELIRIANENEKSIILDIGCAEGYYAVGMALRCPQSFVIAYDIASEAQKLTKMMAQLNNKSSQLIIKSECSQGILLNLPGDKGGVIISDIEGEEQNLFTQEVAEHLKKYHLLIEVHDAYDINCFGILKEVFSKTHELEIIRVVPDTRKVYEYTYEELHSWTLEEKYHLFREKRESGQWFYCKPL